tara:strand:+ start:193 stop:444 length:252 start_codon:yes stop_codon:yes gene_type:complete
MTGTEAITYLVAVIVGLALIWLLIFFIKAVVIGAIVLIQPASAQGFVGFAAYVAMWVLLFPVMLGICALVGALRIIAGTGTEW